MINYKILINDFHGTEYRTRGGVLSPSTVRRIRKALCGIQGCTCGGVLGERGPDNPTVLEFPDGEIMVLGTRANESS